MGATSSNVKAFLHLLRLPGETTHTERTSTVQTGSRRDQLPVLGPDGERPRDTILRIY